MADTVRAYYRNTLIDAKNRADLEIMDRPTFQYDKKDLNVVSTKVFRSFFPIDIINFNYNSGNSNYVSFTMHGMILYYYQGFIFGYAQRDSDLPPGVKLVARAPRGAREDKVLGKIKEDVSNRITNYEHPHVAEVGPEHSLKSCIAAQFFENYYGNGLDVLEEKVRAFIEEKKREERRNKS